MDEAVDEHQIESNIPAVTQVGTLDEHAPIFQHQFDHITTDKRYVQAFFQLLSVTHLLQHEISIAAITVLEVVHEVLVVQ